MDDRRVLYSWYFYALKQANDAFIMSFMYENAIFSRRDAHIVELTHFKHQVDKFNRRIFSFISIFFFIFKLRREDTLSIFCSNELDKRNKRAD